MATAEFRVPHRLKIIFVWASITVTVILVAYQYHKRSSYWELHVSNAMQAMTIAPAPTLAGDLDPVFPVSQGPKKTRYTLYHFWATWCAPCRAEIPTLNALQQRFASDLTVVTISADESKDDVLRFFANKAPHFQVLWDKSQKVSVGFKVEKFPESFLISSDGKTAIRFSGARDWNAPEAVDYLGRLLAS